MIASDLNDLNAVSTFDYNVQSFLTGVLWLHQSSYWCPTL